MVVSEDGERDGDEDEDVHQALEQVVPMCLVGQRIGSQSLGGPQPPVRPTGGETWHRPLPSLLVALGSIWHMPTIAVGQIVQFALV